MRIGILGAGNLGGGLAKRLAAAGHEVMLSFSRDGAKLRAEADAAGARAGSAAEAARFGEVVVLAAPWPAVPEALRQAGAPGGRPILWDCTNALKPDLSGLAVGTTTSAGEEVAKLAPWARVVKAIPPFAEVLRSPHQGDGRASVFVCGDDAAARDVVTGLVTDVGGDAINAGPLELARYSEPAAMLLVQLAYRQGFGAHIGLLLQRG